MKVEITRDGDSELVDIDLNPGRFTMKELVRLEEQIGPEATDDLMKGKVAVRPSLMRALIFAKLATTKYADVEVDEVDVDLSELEAFADEIRSESLRSDGPLPMPMQIGDEQIAGVVEEPEGKA